jgi:RNA polymerase sigma factor (sigma-70 family)
MSPIDQPLTLAERIYHARGADLLRYLRQRLRNDADARDIAQEAFLRFLRLDDPERVRNPEAYIFRIAGNLLWERRLRQHAELGKAPLEETLMAEQTPLDIAVADEEAARLRATLKALPPLRRAVLVLHIRDGLSFSQIAVESGITTSLAKKHYYRALIACREHLIDFKIDQGKAK